jgi:2-oxoglutarate ferredoxin oxidoreductase subunit beta
MIPTCSLDELGLASDDGADVAFSLADYGAAMPRWCHGCGNGGILTGLQRLCQEEQLPPERTVVVSGIGCSSRLPHYMGTYGFHGLHGRALPIAEGVKIRRPDLDVFVVTGDGDCCSIGAAHWIHALRYNMNMTVLLHDNGVYGLTKKQASPTSSRGLVTNTTPRGVQLGPLNPLATTLGASNISFVAQVADWLPGIMADVLRMAYHHRGLSFVRVLQRCPRYMPEHYDDFIRHPERLILLTHPDGLQLDEASGRRFSNQRDHDPADLHGAMELARLEDEIPVGVLFRDDTVACYDDLVGPPPHLSTDARLAALERELDRFTVNPEALNAAAPALSGSAR